MNMIKTALSSAVALGIALSGTVANAEAIRSGAATPGVVSVNKAKLARTSAPAKDESKAYVGNVPIAIAAAFAAGIGGYFIARGDGTADIFDSSGG